MPAYREQKPTYSGIFYIDVDVDVNVQFDFKLTKSTYQIQGIAKLEVEFFHCLCNLIFQIKKDAYLEIL